MINSKLNGLLTQPYRELSSNQLPIRGEKRIIPVPVTTSAAAPMSAWQVAAMRAQPWSMVMVRIPGRGTTATGVPDPHQSAYFQFLVNPSQVQVNMQTVDMQTLSKGGWQFGVWGEDYVNISMQGKTPGRYFAKGLTDQYAEFSESYRNLTALEVVFENNGYYFEGEQMNEGPLASNSLRRRIHMHQDVELTIGEFVWSGMFDVFSVIQEADAPFLAQFSLTFAAWTSRYRSGTPYANVGIRNNTQRGASPAAVPSTPSAAARTNTILTAPSSLDATQRPTLSNSPNVSPFSYATSPSQASALLESGVSGDDASVISPIFQPSTAHWNGSI